MKLDKIFRTIAEKGFAKGTLAEGIGEKECRLMIKILTEAGFENIGPHLTKQKIFYFYLSYRLKDIDLFPEMSVDDE